MQRDKDKLLSLRKKMKEKRPSFRRVESWRLIRVKDSWRKPIGIDSQTRKKEKSGVKAPSIGYRTPKKVRHLHPSGYEEIRVETIPDLQGLNPKRHAIKISSKLGARKRITLVNYAQARNFKILNLGISQKEIEGLEAILDSSIEGLEEGEDLFDGLDDLESDIDMGDLGEDEDT